MGEVISQAQPYIQLEEAMKAFFNHSAKPGDGGGKSKSLYEAPAMFKTDTGGQPAHKRKALSILPPNAL